MNRVLVIGIDGATFDLIRPWAEAGDLPNMARLMAEGVHGPLESTLPPVTAPAWTTFATGQNPGKHSVFDFIQPLAASSPHREGRTPPLVGGGGGGSPFDLVNSSSIRAPTLWQIISEAGRKAGVMNVPVTYPPVPINGFVITGMLSPVGGNFTYPADLLDRYAGQIKPYRIAPHVQYKPGNETAFTADLLDLVERRGEYALQLMSDYPYDFLMFHFLSTDTMQHAFWKFVDPTHPRYDPQAAARFGPALKQVYRRIDGFIGQMLDRILEETTVIVMSDHGFGPLHYVVNLNLFLLDQGLLQLKRGAWTRLKTNLFRAGLTPASFWHLIERTGLQNYVWQVSKSTRNKVVDKFLSFDDVDWSRTSAYSIGHVGQIYVNLKGREPEGFVEPDAECEAVQQQVIQTLHELSHPETGQPLVDQVIPGSQAVHGPYAHRGPDLHVVMDGYRTIAFPLFATDNRIVTRQIRGDSGCHRLHGIFIAWGPEIKAGETVEGARILDLAPTILHLTKLPVPDEMDGRVLTEALTTSRPVARQAAPPLPPLGGVREGTEAGLSAEETAEVKDRLRALGYLG
ncbi:MAG: alkaline phosphatase family protein [Chloroflexota bacterium]|nr:alkaline phosphatase family protein [Chloroflexota bacterium]